jgi:hypothetical protein
MALWQAYAELAILSIEEARLTDDAARALDLLVMARRHLDRAVEVLESKAEIPE